MQTKNYLLPEWDLVGGETQKRTFTLYKIDRVTKYDLPDATAELAIVDFVNQRSAPRIRKEIDIRSDESGTYCEAIISLSPLDTVDLFGKYIYQITIKDGLDNVVALKGIMHITENVNKLFVTDGVIVKHLDGGTASGLS